MQWFPKEKAESLEKFKSKINIIVILKVCIIILFPLNATISFLYYEMVDDTNEKAVAEKSKKIIQIIDENVTYKYRQNTKDYAFVDFMVKKDDEKNLDVIRNYLVKEGFERHEIDADRPIKVMWHKDEPSKDIHYVEEREAKENNEIVFRLVYRQHKSSTLLF